MPTRRTVLLSALTALASRNIARADNRHVIFWFTTSEQDAIQNCPFSSDIYRIVSNDLPCHGHDVRDAEPPELEGWRYRIDRGEDLLGDFIKRCSSKLDDLGLKKVFCGGISRGGFAALHLSSRDPRFAYVAALSPVTDLLALTEFAGCKSDTHPLHKDAGILAERSLFLSIQSQDDRVSTKDAIDLVGKIVTGSRRADVTLCIDPGSEHQVSNAARRAAVEWISSRRDI